MNFTHINYTALNSRQKERYNFQKLAGVLADYGFSCIKLDDDWQGADFLAQHIDGSTIMRIQLKARLTFSKKYLHKDIFIAFPHKDHWYLFNHDELLSKFLETFHDQMAISHSWTVGGGYSWNSLGKRVLELLEPYQLNSVMNAAPID